MLDDAINAPETTTNDTIRHNFRDKAMGFSTCEPFSPCTFVDDARRQAENIRAAIDVLKNDSVAPLDADKALRIARSDYASQMSAFLASDTRAMWTVTLTRADGVQIARKAWGAFPDMTPEPEPVPTKSPTEE